MRFQTVTDIHRSMGDLIKKCPVWSSVTNKSEGKMYGILLESIQFYVVRDVGEETWHKILEHAGIKNMIFTTHDTYKDEVMTSLARSCAHVTKTKDTNEWMTFFGTCFVEFCSGYGYDKLLRVAGRNYRDFLHGIDNIHEIIRFSYPRLQSPSFLVLSEDPQGCVLLYQSKRHGFKHYVKGQLQQCALKFYHVTVDITLMEEVFVEGRTHVKFRLDFDNSAYMPVKVPDSISGKQKFSSLTGDRFLQVFPFCIVFNSQLIIKSVGPSMAAFLKGDNLVGCSLREKFLICRPLIPCVWSKILRFQGVIFELEYLHGGDIGSIDHHSMDITGLTPRIARSEKSFEERILLRGEMKYIKEWDRVAFLCTPLINNLNHLQSTGLFINDLNMFDMSRDMVMAGWQYASQLERSIEKQRGESETTSNNMKEIEAWKKKSNSLLYAMIPQAIADRLKSGEKPINTCEVFDNVTIMFNYMVGFADICANATPMEIVTCINDVFILFDQIVDKYNVFKVETLGDAVYMVAGGVPDRSPDHAINVAGLALELQEKAKSLLDPMSTSLNTRIGMHTGSVVGGVVGRRMPQYCLFGDTVNTAARMQTYSLPGRIHISEPCYECLKESDFVTVERGTVNIKGKGEMKTYWLAGKAGETKTSAFLQEITTEKSQSVLKLSSFETALDLHGMHASTSSAQFSLTFGVRNESSTNLFHKAATKSGSNTEAHASRHVSQAGLAQTPEETDDDLLRVSDDIPVISISEPDMDTPVRSPDDASCDSVTFFLTADDMHQRADAESDSGVSVTDVQLDLPSQTKESADTDLKNMEQIHAGEDTALLDSEESLLDHEVSLLDHEEKSVIEDDSCVNFTGCPLFSSIFNAPVLRCSPCGYFSDSNDDDKVAQTIQSHSPVQNPISLFDEQDSEKVRLSEPTEQVIMACKREKSNVPSGAMTDDLSKNSSPCKPETNIPKLSQPQCFQSTDLSDSLIKIMENPNPAIGNPLNPTGRTLNPSENLLNPSGNPLKSSGNSLKLSGNLLNPIEQLPVWLKKSKDSACFCSHKSRQITHKPSGEECKGSCISSVPSYEPTKCVKACKCSEDKDDTQTQACSQPSMFCQCTTRSCGLPLASAYDPGPEGPGSYADANGKPQLPTDCDKTATASKTSNSSESRTCACNTLTVNALSDTISTHGALNFHSTFVTCENGKCLANGDTRSKVSVNSTPVLSEPKYVHVCAQNSIHHLPPPEFDDVPRELRVRNSTEANNQNHALANGKINNLDTPRNGIVTEIPEHLICPRLMGHRGSETNSKSFSDFQMSYNKAKYHRCYSDPGARPNGMGRQPKQDSKAESNV